MYVNHGQLSTEPTTFYRHSKKVVIGLRDAGAGYADGVCIYMKPVIFEMCRAHRAGLKVLAGGYCSRAEGKRTCPCFPTSHQLWVHMHRSMLVTIRRQTYRCVSLARPVKQDAHAQRGAYELARHMKQSKWSNATETRKYRGIKLTFAARKTLPTTKDLQVHTVGEAEASRNIRSR